MWRGRRDRPSEAERERQEVSRRSLESGGLPLHAVERLREQAARRDSPQSLFTSALSVNEFLLTRQAGFEALGQVTGSTVYHIGTQWRQPNWRDSDRGKAFSYEMDMVTRAFYNARHLALGRMQQEATMLGAAGVVGVRLRRTPNSESRQLMEFVAIGTAIAETGRRPIPGGSGTSDRLPFLSNLTGQDFWTLRQAGYRPVGLVVGNCTYAHVPSLELRRLTMGLTVAVLQNRELTEYSEALSQARTLGMQRLADEARALGAEGVVGTQIEVETEPATQEDGQATIVGMLYQFTAIGTAIASAPGGSAPTAGAVLPLR